MTQTLTVTLPSVTQANKAKTAFDKSGISSSIVRLDPAKTAHGCAFGIRVDTDRETVQAVLHRGRVRYGEFLDTDVKYHKGSV